jgi:transcriptional regulator with XRE-family HTH domain
MAIAGAGLRPQDVRREMGLSREKMGYVMSVSAKTIENWERRNQLPADEEKRARLAAIEELVRLGLLVYGETGLPIFLRTPLRSLGNHTPLQEMMAGRIERVIEILASEYEGLGF